jgi:rod shape determining protein RodA
VRQNSIYNLDLTLLLCTLIACAVGIIMVFSATKTSHSEGLSLSDFTMRQAIYALVGILLMFIVARFDYRFIESFTLPLYVVTLALLGIVLVLGMVAYGAQRWLHLGLFPIQPSELAKLTVVIVLAKVLADHERQIDRVKWFVLAGLIAAIPAVIVFRQPDLGTAVVLGLIFLGMAVGARVPFRLFAALGVLAVPATYVFWNYVMHDYQRKRLFIFLDPESDLLGQGYNIIQARISIGSGGWFGQGYMMGTQSQLGFTKVQYSDFIFSVVAEEFGFFGALALIVLLFIVVWRCLVVASRARDTFGSLIAVGVATWIGAQIFINIGMNIGLMPVTGIPLPFISYGGSSLVSLLLALGLVQSVALRSSPVIFGGPQPSPVWSTRTILRPR